MADGTDAQCRSRFLIVLVFQRQAESLVPQCPRLTGLPFSSVGSRALIARHTGGRAPSLKKDAAPHGIWFIFSSVGVEQNTFVIQLVAQRAKQRGCIWITLNSNRIYLTNPSKTESRIPQPPSPLNSPSDLTYPLESLLSRYAHCTVIGFASLANRLAHQKKAVVSRTTL